MSYSGQWKSNKSQCWSSFISWMDQMRIKLNADKTEYITFGSRTQLQKVSSSPLIAGNDVIQMSSDVKYLGGILVNKLNFNKNITMKIKKAMSNFICIRAIQKYLSKQAYTTLVLTLCILHLDYGNAVLYGLAKKSIKRLQTEQTMCAKLVLQCSKYSSTTQALMALTWLPIEQQIQYKILTIMYKGIKNIAPKYVMDLIEISKLRRDNMWSTNAGIRLNVPPVRYKTFAARSFHYAATTLWNALPKNIIESKTLDKFQQALKIHIRVSHWNKSSQFTLLTFTTFVPRPKKVKKIFLKFSDTVLIPPRPLKFAAI